MAGSTLPARRQRRYWQAGFYLLFLLAPALDLLRFDLYEAQLWFLGMRWSLGIDAALRDGAPGQAAWSVLWRGIVPAHIRSELERSGRYSSAALAAMDDREVVMKIFEPGFSTASSAGIDAGRGVGMDLVKERVSRLGGQLKLASRPNEFTSFALRFAAAGVEV